MIPTHRILKLTLEGKATVEERTFARKLRSLKDMLLEKLDNLKEGKNEQEQRKTIKEAQDDLKESIRKECEEEKTKLQVLAQAKDTNGYWRVWSKTVERGWLRYVDESKVYNPAFVGRGKVELISKKPKDEKKKTYLRGKEARAEITAIRQARRCEQMGFRINLTKMGRRKPRRLNMQSSTKKR